MINNKNKIEDGLYFFIPIEDVAFIGMVFRKYIKSEIAFCCIFKQIYNNKNFSVVKIADLTPYRKLRIGSKFIIKGKWPTICNDPNFNKNVWPLPDFIMRDPITFNASRVIYSNLDIGKVEAIIKEDYNNSDLETDALYSAEATELLLKNILINQKHDLIFM